MPENFTPSCNLRLLYLQNIAVHKSTSLFRQSLHYRNREVIHNVNRRTQTFNTARGSIPGRGRISPWPHVHTRPEAHQTFDAQTLRLTPRLRSGTSGACGILCKSQMRIHMVNYSIRVCVYIYIYTYTYTYIHTHIQGSPAEIQTPTHWSLIGRSITAPLPVLSPSSILPPLSSHCALLPARKNAARALKISFQGFTFLKS